MKQENDDKQRIREQIESIDATYISSKKFKDVDVAQQRIGRLLSELAEETDLLEKWSETTNGIVYKVSNRGDSGDQDSV